MATKETLQFRSNVGKTSGFANLFYMEISRWWKSNDWTFQILLWSVIINISLAGVLTQDIDGLGIISILALFFGMFPSIAVVIIMQDVIIGERESGTVQWILSKPCSRISFIFSKIISNIIGVVISMVLVPGLIAYLLIAVMAGIIFDPIAYLFGLGIMSILMIFYLTLTIMLGTVNKQRGLVIGLPLLFNFGIITTLQGIKDVFIFVPHGLFFPISTEYSLFSSVILNQPVETFIPLVVSIFSCSFNILYSIIYSNRCL
ncbi:MAG: ABC transporter permease [Candidatus Hodarchaeales archaeon]|jgi:ABC-2 type transport system permease protein